MTSTAAIIGAHASSGGTTRPMNAEIGMPSARDMMTQESDSSRRNAAPMPKQDPRGPNRERAYMQPSTATSLKPSSWVMRTVRSVACRYE